MADKRNYKHISPAKKKELIEQAKYYLFHLGYTQKKTANLIEVSENTLSKWVQDLGYTDKLKGRNRVEVAEQLKTEKNLPMFIAFVRVRHNDKYETVERLYKEYLDKH